jgi:nitrate/nitrite transporter NarK
VNSHCHGVIWRDDPFHENHTWVSFYGSTAIKFKEAMYLTPSMMGLLVAIPALSGSLLSIPFGAWVDTTGGKKLIKQYHPCS